MIKGTTESGFEFELEDEVFDDAELVDLLVEIDEGKGQFIGRALEMVLGKDQKKALYDHCRKDGKVSFGNLGAEFRSIFEEAGKKNS